MEVKVEKASRPPVSTDRLAEALEAVANVYADLAVDAMRAGDRYDTARLTMQEIGYRNKADALWRGRKP